MHLLLPEYAARFWADLELRSSHHHLDRPKQPLIHRPKSLQMHLLWPEFAGRSWADLELRSSHHQRLNCPQATTDPSAKIAANAKPFAWIWCTLLSWSWTSEQSPPVTSLPQAFTDPSFKITANAVSVAWICRTFLSWSWTAEQSPPKIELPQATTDPSAKIAANAKPFAWIWCTLLSWSWTSEQSPPVTSLPQAFTDPSFKITANAVYVAWICRTFLSWSWTAEQSPPWSRLPQATTDPSANIAANAPSVAWICWTFMSWSWTTEQSPPSSGLPQEITDPSVKIAANALSVAWISWTFQSTPSTTAQSPPPSGLPQATTWLPPEHHKANAWPVCVLLSFVVLQLLGALLLAPLQLAKRSQGWSGRAPPQWWVSGILVVEIFGPEFSSPPLWSVQEVADFPQNHSGTKCLLEALEERKKTLTISHNIIISYYFYQRLSCNILSHRCHSLGRCSTHSCTISSWSKIEMNMKYKTCENTVGNWQSALAPSNNYFPWDGNFISKRNITKQRNPDLLVLDFLSWGSKEGSIYYKLLKEWWWPRSSA